MVRSSCTAAVAAPSRRVNGGRAYRDAIGGNALLVNARTSSLQFGDAGSASLKGVSPVAAVPLLPELVWRFLRG